MCFNISITQVKIDELEKRYKAVIPAPVKQPAEKPQLPLFYFVSGFSHPLLPIIKHDGIVLSEWGLIPSWIKDKAAADDIRSKTLNAVGGTIFEKPSFRKSIVSQRCLLPVTGFFEWQDVNGTKYPYFIHLKSNPVFSLGCIFENRVDKSTGEIKNTFSIITTPANPMMEKIHNLKKRMPLIIGREDEKEWVNPSLSKEKIMQLIQPYHNEDMTAYTISKNCNSSRYNRNVAEILEKVDYPELSLS